MSETLRGGVIGAGVFGGYHARQYARLPGVTLSAVLDPHPERAAALAAPLGGRAFHELEAFLEAVDVVTIASPATCHAEQALAGLAAWSGWQEGWGTCRESLVAIGGGKSPASPCLSRVLAGVLSRIWASGLAR